MVIGCGCFCRWHWKTHLDITRGFLSTISVGLKAMIIISIVWISVVWIFYFLIFDIERICFGIRFLWAYRWTNTLLVKTKSTDCKRRAYKNTFKVQLHYIIYNLYNLYIVEPYSMDIQYSPYFSLMALISYQW